MVTHCCHDDRRCAALTTCTAARMATHVTRSRRVATRAPSMSSGTRRPQPRPCPRLLVHPLRRQRAQEGRQNVPRITPAVRLGQHRATTAVAPWPRWVDTCGLCWCWLGIHAQPVFTFSLFPAHRQGLVN